MPPPEKRRLLEDKLTRSAYFLGALLFHLIIFLMVATRVVFKAPPTQPDFVAHFIRSVPDNPPPQPPISPIAPGIDSSATASVSTVIPSPSNPHIIIQDNPIDVTGPQAHGPQSLPTNANPTGHDPRALRIKRIHDTVFNHWHRTQEEINNHDPTATFPVYVAAYADGDWACNTRFDQDGNIVAGSIPDLVAKINEWSHGHIKGEVVPKPLNIGGPELLDQMPPFIFFTGHKDFVLTDQEVANLRDYLEGGGAIWGDNALAGQGSRFDVAFRREMKRVVPDRDKNFEPMTMDSDLFAKSWFSISQVPKGMNYSSEPIEHLDIDGKLAILYTPNDYSDLFFMRILPGDTQMGGWYPDRKSNPFSPLFTSGTFLYNSNVFFRNFTLQSSLAVHRLGMNIVTYLLTRFDDELLLNP
jgi:Domain of unknown function (DUF4159)